MWTCPKCGRPFKRTNQGHYCGKAPADVPAYIQSQPSETQVHLTELRSLILDAVPGVQERIAWSMPFYEKEQHSVSFAACKRHISLYIDPEILEPFKPHLDGFEIKKNALYLPYSKALPAEVIQSMIRQCFGAKQQSSL